MLCIVIGKIVQFVDRRICLFRMQHLIPPHLVCFTSVMENGR